MRISSGYSYLLNVLCLRVFVPEEYFPGTRNPILRDAEEQAISGSSFKDQVMKNILSLGVLPYQTIITLTLNIERIHYGNDLVIAADGVMP